MELTKETRKKAHVLKIEKKIREAFKTETNPTIRKMIEENQRFRDRSDRIFPEWPIRRR